MKAQHRPWLKNTHCAPDHVKSIKHFFLKCLLLQTAITLCISPKQNKTKQNRTLKLTLLGLLRTSHKISLKTTKNYCEQGIQDTAKLQKNPKMYFFKVHHSPFHIEMFHLIHIKTTGLKYILKKS